MDPSPAAAAVIGVTGVDVVRTVPSNPRGLFPKDPIIRRNLRPVLMGNLMVRTLFRPKNNPQKRGPVTITNVAVATDTATVVVGGTLVRDQPQREHPLPPRSQRQSRFHCPPQMQMGINSKKRKKNPLGGRKLLGQNRGCLFSPTKIRPAIDRVVKGVFLLCHHPS
jgi:hypothetical protein